MITNLFINGLGDISRLQNFQKGITSIEEPVYKDRIAPIKLRRMSRIMRMSNYAALTALYEADIEIPKMINVATGYGCLADTENYLATLLEQDEKFANPLSFINSTHTTLAGNLAILLGATGENFTFIHQSFSFEYAMINAKLALEEGDLNDALVGGVDEKITTLEIVLKDMGIKQVGEGASFLSISKEGSTKSFAKITAIQFVRHEKISMALIEGFLKENELTNKEIDLLFTNGDFNLSFEHQIDYSEISGSYPTSIAFACAWGAKVIRDQKIEDVVAVGISKFNTILIVHEYCNNEKSLILIQKP